MEAPESSIRSVKTDERVLWSVQKHFVSAFRRKIWWKYVLMYVASLYVKQCHDKHKVKLWKRFQYGRRARVRDGVGKQRNRIQWSEKCFETTIIKKYFASDNRRWQIMEHQLWQYHLKCLSDCGRENKQVNGKNNFVQWKSLVESPKGEFHANYSCSAPTANLFMTNRHFCCGKTCSVGLHPTGSRGCRSQHDSWFCSSQHLR